MSQRRIKAVSSPATLKHAEKAMAIDLRRRASRGADITRLNRARKLPLLGFKWAERYNAVYVCKYARKKGWSQGRLNWAIKTLDEKMRGIQIG